MRTIWLYLFGFLFLGIAFLANGQTEKGKILIGGETKLNFTSLNSIWKSDDGNGKEGNILNFDFSPQFGLFVKDNFALGVQLPLTYSFEKKENVHKYSSTSVALAPFIRYYFGKNNIKPYLHGGVGLGYQKYKYGNYGLYPDSEPDPGFNPILDLNYGMFLYELGGGISIFINEKTSIDVGLGYSSISSKSLEDNDNNYRIITRGIGLGLGFSVIL